MVKTSGYSSTPLAKKLGLKSDYSVYLVNQPKHYWKLFEELPKGICEVHQPELASVDFIHLFCSTKQQLVIEAEKCKSYLKKSGHFWVSWPKGSSKIPTDLKREPIREYLLNIGLVDVKVASIDLDWSGLKFVYRVKDR
jgi:hypothetical protein